jgi:hypothetical protein
MTSPNQTLETNCRPARPLGAGRQLGRAICTCSDYILICSATGAKSGRPLVNFTEIGRAMRERGTCVTRACSSSRRAFQL